MIYHLFDTLKDLNIPGQRLFSYLSTRAMFAGVVAMLVAFIAGGSIIRLLQRKQIGETIRDLGLEGQMQKKGTPTMGGVIIIFAVLSGALLFCDLTNIYVQLLLLTTIWCGAMGFADDYIKVFRHNKEGMSAKMKIALQLLLGLVIGMTVWLSSDIVVRERVQVNENTSHGSSLTVDSEKVVTSGRWASEDVVKTTTTTIPFVKSHEFDYRSLSPFKGAWGWYCKWAIYVLMIVIVIISCSNCVNLTDGLDGLSAGSSAIVGMVIGIMAWMGSSLVNSGYLNIMYMPGTGEVAVFMAAFVGALLGFLWYNSFPAQVFMGDTGSLTIGGIIGVSAILIRKELLLPLLGGIFLVEGLSVILQRYYFKFTKKKYGEGRRIFKMAPLHHHFQKEGVPAAIKSPARALPESKITARFWIVGIILAISTLALLKIR